MLRDATGSTKRLSSDSKAAGPRNQRLCLVPHTCRFLWTAIVGCRTDSEGLKSSPHPPWGTTNPTSQSYGRVTAFLRPRLCRIAFRCGKGWPQHPSKCVEAKVARFCFPPLGTRRPKAADHTTGPCPHRAPDSLNL